MAYDLHCHRKQVYCCRHMRQTPGDACLSNITTLINGHSQDSEPTLAMEVCR
jgi:hypothetical protein